MSKFFSVSLALTLLTPVATLAAPPESASEIKLLRQEIEALRAAHEARLQALERRLMAAEQAASASGAAPAATASAAPAVAATPPPASTVDASTTKAPSAGTNAFNPAISLILSGGFTRTSLDPERYAISGFHLPSGAEAGPGTRGFSLAESELGLSASIDPWLRGAAAIALHPDDAVSVEEAYIETTAMGKGLTLKAGRFFSGVGYLNAQHAHNWDFVDNPLAYQAMLGTQYGDDGLQLRWLAPTDQYFELSAELGRGRSYPGGDSSRNGAGMRALSAHTGGDLGDSHSWRAGLSVLSAKASEQELSAIDAAGGPLGPLFSGNTRVWLLDGVWKWAPNGNATRSNFKLQAEYLRSTREGSLNVDLDGVAVTDRYRAAQSGWYVQGVYQFMPSWRLGLRTERLNPGTPDFGLNAAGFATSAYQPRKNTVMLDFSPSEFSRIRLQLANDRSKEGAADRQLFIQYQMSLGAHGGHGY